LNIAVALLPSLKEAEPVPARVITVPSGVSFLTLWEANSAKKIRPVVSLVTSKGPFAEEERAEVESTLLPAPLKANVCT
jgi:hypothetical protein